MEPNKILIFGRGQLGTFYKDHFEGRGVEVVTPRVDIRDLDQVRKAVTDACPDVVINCAAKTNIDWCEQNRTETFEVNTLGADNVAAATDEAGKYLLHISSGCVQESLTADDVKSEDDPPNPLCYYAWTKVWAEYLKSPVLGHGYFVTSETGEMEVWYMKANHAAHNIYLQVLAGTGGVGLAIFLVAIGSLCCKFSMLRLGDGQSRKLFSMLVFVFVWYLGWSLLSTSFMGPVRSESVVFFTFVGLGLGQLARVSQGMGSVLAVRRAAVWRPTPDRGDTVPGTA